MIKTILTAGAILASSTLALFADAPTSFDVAEDHTRFSYAATPVDADGMPMHGNAFVTQGYIYPAGTVTGSTPGVLEDGSPAYPDKVLGTWTCDGWFVGDAMNTKSGTWLISRQVFEFRNGDILVSQGPEKADIGLSYERPITGATGNYVKNDGDMWQTFLGMTEYMGVNVHFDLYDERHAYLGPDHEDEIAND